eukprot:4086664-Amphidinium_carterae.3
MLSAQQEQINARAQQQASYTNLQRVVQDNAQAVIAQQVNIEPATSSTNIRDSGEAHANSDW